MNEDKFVSIIGCDATTYIPFFRFTNEEIDVIAKLAHISHEYSDYGCEPTIRLQKPVNRTNVYGDEYKSYEDMEDYGGDD